MRLQGNNGDDLDPLVSSTEVVAELRKFDSHDALTAIEAEELRPPCSTSYCGRGPNSYRGFVEMYIRA